MSANIVRLLGVPGDREKLERLAASLSRHGMDCELDLRGPRSRKPLEIEVAQAGEGTPPAYALCWTEASIGREGSRIQECAIELKSNNLYVGLLLDDVVPPEQVRSADELNLVAMSGSGDGAAVNAAVEALKARVRARQAGGRSFPWSRILDQLTGAIRRMGGRVRAIGIISAVTFLVAVFGFYANWIGSQDEICKRGWMQGFCRSIDAGHLPSDREINDWSAIVGLERCESFESHLVKYGPNGHYAGEARQRLALWKPVPTPTPMKFRLSIPFAEARAADSTAAKAETLRRASREAAGFCTDYAQVYQGEDRPGTFRSSEDVFCEGAPGRYLCRVRGHAQCVFLVSGDNRICPAGKP